MSELILLGVIVFLLGLIAFMEHNNRKERKSMLNAILSKNHEELVNLELVDKTDIKVKPEKAAEDLIPMGGLTDDEFDKYALGKDNG